MSLFRFQWLRTWIRRHSSPIHEDKASLWKKRLAIIYALVAWNAFGFVLFQVFTGKGDWAKYHGVKDLEEIKLTPAQQWTKTLGIKDATVYRISGLNVSKYEVHNKFDEANGESQLNSTKNNEAQ